MLEALTPLNHPRLNDYAATAAVTVDRKSTALTTVDKTDSYVTLSKRFETAVAEVGTSGGTPIKAWVPNVAQALLLIPTTSGAIIAGAAAGVAALLGVEVGITAAVAGGIGTVIPFIGAPHVQELFEGRAKLKTANVLAKRGMTPLEPKSVVFARNAFDAADPIEQVQIGALAKTWLAVMDTRKIIGHEARELLRGIVRDSDAIDPEIREESERCAAVKGALYDTSGELRAFSNILVANDLLRALASLKDATHAAVMPGVRETLFDGETPRVAMTFDTCQELLAGLQPRAAAQ